MKTLAAIKNELFQDYLKIISTNNLEQTLDNPLVPVPFTCIASLENQNADLLVVEINKFFEHKKIKNKDFLHLDEKDISHLHFLFNLIQLSTSGVSNNTNILRQVEPPKSIEVTQPEFQPIVEENTVLTKETEQKVLEEEIPFIEEESPFNENLENKQKESFLEAIEDLVIPTDKKNNESIVKDDNLIKELGIPKNSVIHLIKDEKITAIIIDEKHIEFEGEVIPVTEGTKKAFKKAGVTGMALGLANWNYNGQNLKSLKDNK